MGMLFDLALQARTEVGRQAEGANTRPDPAAEARRQRVLPPLPFELEAAIRQMAAAWQYPPEDLQWALQRAAADPAGWWALVGFDAEWRRVH